MEIHPHTHIFICIPLPLLVLKKKRLFTTHFCIIDYTMGLYPEVCELVQKKNKAHCGRCGVSEEVVNETSTVRGLAWRDG